MLPHSSLFVISFFVFSLAFLFLSPAVLFLPGAFGDFFSPFSSFSFSALYHIPAFILSVPFSSTPFPVPFCAF
jgi:hypothetical protein